MLELLYLSQSIYIKTSHLIPTVLFFLHNSNYCICSLFISLKSMFVNLMNLLLLVEYTDFTVVGKVIILMSISIYTSIPIFIFLAVSILKCSFLKICSHFFGSIQTAVVKNS